MAQIQSGYEENAIRQWVVVRKISEGLAGWISKNVSGAIPVHGIVYSITERQSYSWIPVLHRERYDILVRWKRSEKHADERRQDLDQVSIV